MIENRKGEFKAFVLVEQRKEVLAFSALFALLSAFFLICYPQPFIIEDSLDYIRMADLNASSGARPIGYSVFLDVLHSIGTSYYVVIVTQFLLTFLSGMFFLMTIRFFFRPNSRWASWLFSTSVLFAPASLYLNIWITSDALYTALTLTWLAFGVWLLKTNEKRFLIAFLLVLLALGNIRYIGIAVSLLPAVLFLFSRTRMAFITALLALAIGALTYIGTKAHIRNTFGVDTISAVSGMAKMNSVGLMYPHLGEEFYELEFTEKEQRWVHLLMAKCYKQRPQCFEESAFFGSETETGGGPHFMWGRECPLTGLQFYLWKSEKLEDPVRQLRAGSILEKYASSVNRAYPLKYLRYYVLPNLKRLFLPEFLLEGFRFKGWDVKPQVKSWFDVTVKKFEPTWDIYFDYLRPLSAPANNVIWIATITVFVVLVIRRGRLDFDRFQYLVLLLLAGYIVVYVGFSLIAHPILLRYLVPMHAAQMASMYIILNELIQSGSHRGHQKKKEIQLEQ